MAKRESSFQKLPPQFDWAFPILLGYCTYLFMVSEGMVSILCILTALIILNGWISSRATEIIYSDLLLFIDLLGMFLYFCMALTLDFSRNKVLPKYWLFCAGVCAAYFFWDIAILPLVGKEDWKKRFRLYVIIMAFSILFFIGLYGFQKFIDGSESTAVICGSLFWLGLLGKWHWDVIIAGKQEQNNGE